MTSSTSADDARRAPAPGHASRRLALLVAPAVLAADVASKAAAARALTPGESVPILDGLVRLHLGFNSGIAFGLLADAGDVLVWLTALVAAALVVWLVRSYRAGEGWRRTVPLGLVIGGAFGNVADRAPDGVVTDFLDLGLLWYRWPAFNVADTAIVVGVLGLLLLARQRAALLGHHPS